MTFKKVNLKSVAPAKASKIKFEDPSNVWLLNLDQIESGSSSIESPLYGSLSEAGSSTASFDTGNVLYSKLRPYLNKVVCPEEPEIATTELVPLRPDPKKLDRYYLTHYLRSSTFVNWVSAKVAGAKMPRVSMTDFWSHEIPLPPLEEQKRIAAILDKADELRKQRQESIDLCDKFLKALFVDMFGDPITNPKGWDVQGLSSLGKWQSGGTPSRSNPEYFNGNTPWLTSGELESMYVGHSAEEITEEAIANSNTKLIKPGSLLLGMYDTAALKSCITSNEVTCNQAIAYSYLDPDLCNTVFIYTMIQIGKEHYKRMQRGVRQKNLNLTMIKDLKSIIPPVPLQNEFAEAVKNIESHKTQLIKSQKLMETNFEALSQRAFKGEL